MLRQEKKIYDKSNLRKVHISVSGKTDKQFYAYKYLCRNRYVVKNILKTLEIKNLIYL